MQNSLPQRWMCAGSRQQCWQGGLQPLTACRGCGAQGWISAPQSLDLWDSGSLGSYPDPPVLPAPWRRAGPTRTPPRVGGTVTSQAQNVPRKRFFPNC